jgi:methanol metabolism-related c-type cytochrome
VDFARRSIAVVLAASLLSFGAALAEPPGDPTAVKLDTDTFWKDKDGNPTYKVDAGGSVDFHTYAGFKRYHSECHVCHGPDGEGSTYAPPLRESLKTIGYAEFFGIVVGGKQDLAGGQEKVMPAFGENKNVTCYLNDIYVYLRARSQDVVPRGRPEKHADKPAGFAETEDACLSAK